MPRSANPFVEDVLRLYPRVMTMVHAGEVLGYSTRRAREYLVRRFPELLNRPDTEKGQAHWRITKAAMRRVLEGSY